MPKIGADVVFGDHVHLGENAVVGDRVVLGKGVEIGANVVVGDYSRIGPGSRIRSGAVIGKYAVIGDRVLIGPQAEVGNDVVINDDVHIESRVRLGDGIVLLEGVKIGGSFHRTPPQVQCDPYVVYPYDWDEIAVGCVVHPIEYWLKGEPEELGDHPECQPWREYDRAIRLVADWLADNRTRPEDEPGAGLL